MEIFIVLVFLLINLLAIFYVYRKKSPFLIFIQLWWFFWMFIGTMDITGLFVPSSTTLFVFSLFLTSITFGAVLSETVKKYSIQALNSSNEIIWNKFYRLFIFFLTFILFPISFFLLFKFLKIYFTYQDNFNVSAYRMGVFGERNEFSLFAKPSYSVYYFIFFHPWVFVFLSLGMSFFVAKKKVTLYILAVVLIAIENAYMFGRFGVHYILMSFIILSISNFYLKFITKKNLIKISIYFISIVSIIVAFLIFVTYKKNIPLNQMINHSLLSYHSESFVIFDVNLKDYASILHDNTRGLSSIASIHNSLSVVLSFFGIHTVSEAGPIGGFLHQNFLIGYDHEGGPLYFNAFGSILFSTYRDGGLIFTIGVGISLGVMIGLCINSFNKRNLILNAALFCLLYLCIYGIFQPALSGPLPISIIMLLCLDLGIKVYRKALF